MNRFEKSLKRINKYVEPQDNWTDEDVEHFKTIIEALTKCSESEQERSGGNE